MVEIITTSTTTSVIDWVVWHAKVLSWLNSPALWVSTCAPFVLVIVVDAFTRIAFAPRCNDAAPSMEYYFVRGKRLRKVLTLNNLLLLVLGFWVRVTDIDVFLCIAIRAQFLRSVYCPENCTWLKMLANIGSFAVVWNVATQFVNRTAALGISFFICLVFLVQLTRLFQRAIRRSNGERGHSSSDSSDSESDTDRKATKPPLVRATRSNWEPSALHLTPYRRSMHSKFE